MTSNNTSTTARRSWNPCSQRWRDQMKELAHLEDDKVTKEDGLTFVPDDPRFMILSTSKTEVFLGLWKDGTEIAIKRVRKAIFNQPEFQQELKVLLKLRFNSRHLVQYVDSAQDRYFGYIAMQLCECTLAQYIEGKPAYAERKKRTKEFLKGLKVLHEDAKVIHRDIKPQNILIDSDGRARLADFGISRILDLEQSTMETGNAGTQCWVATEVIKNVQKRVNTRFKRSTDIQVAGMVVYYILSGGKHPFGDPAHCHSNICDGRYTLEDIDDEQAKDLVTKMLNIIPEDRPRITEVLQHPFWEKDSFLPSASKKRRADSPIPVQIGGQESGGQTQEMRTVTESSLRTTNSPNGAQAGVQVPGGQTQEMRTVTDSSLMDMGRPSQSDASAFVDRHTAEIIQRVTSVMPIADVLLSKRVLNHEKYSEISAATTPQKQMRKLFDCLRSAGAKGKTVFYETLLKMEPFLVEDLNAE